ncbi:hypothetical protein DE146DRAFT_633864 [Phaeosphaeria sp. MPI-PUGE-AT-0046c]|nr:hypothetical protein DE146DRAFT_633864 [Phaeosphaeria sp. MPI-PUGE-AT-0046c]
MAPNGHAPADSRTADRSSQPSSRPMWLKRHGSTEFRDWQKEHPTQHLAYDDWKTSKHVDGLSLYYAALQIWDESDSSDEVEEPKVDIRSRSVRAQSAREPKKALKTNGNGLSRSTGSATPSAAAHSEDLNPSSQKKRRKRKQFLSEELVASDESEDPGASTPVVETTTPSASAVTLNGRRKSSGRKPKKKPLSEETISPEDEEDDPMAANGHTAQAIASPLPVRSVPKSSSAGPSSEPPKRTILKLSTRKTPKKKLVETVPNGATGKGHTAGPVESNVALTVEPNLTATSSDRDAQGEDNRAHTEEVTASPDPNGDSASSARRGLRTRRPAQQRPYSYDAEVFDGSDTERIVDETVSPTPPAIQSRRMSVASLSNEPYGQLLDPETLAILQGGMGPEPEQKDEMQGRPKHFKGKGRAWKKEESDEDLEFNPSKKKAAARAKAKAKAKAQLPEQQLPKKKGGRSKKSILSEDVVRDDSDEETPTRTAETSPSRAASDNAPSKGRKTTRKSALSEAIIHDDSDDDEGMKIHDRPASPALAPKVSTSTPKKRGRPRLSDQSASSKTQEAPKEAITSAPAQVTETIHAVEEQAKPTDVSTKDVSPANKVEHIEPEEQTKDESAAPASSTTATNIVNDDISDKGAVLLN